LDSLHEAVTLGLSSDLIAVKIHKIYGSKWLKHRPDILVFQIKIERSNVDPGKKKLVSHLSAAIVSPVEMNLTFAILQ
jgi:hypothetical protein